MAERKMTSKGFLHKATTKAANSAIGFIAAHRKWLETGEASEVCSPILRLIDEGQLMPTPALDLIRHAVFTHMIQANAAKAEASVMEQEESKAQGKSTKDWIGRIFNEKGELQTRINAKGEVEDLEQSFDLASAADRWVDRRLFDGAPDWYGTVEHATIKQKNGDPIRTYVDRQDAIARILKKPRGPVTPRKSQSTQKLSFGVHAKTTRVTFSHG